MENEEMTHPLHQHPWGWQTGSHGRGGNAGPPPDEGGRGPRGHRGRHGRGPRGPRGPWGPPRSRRDRGDVRAAILLLLAEQPRHGYDIITEIADRSEGSWQPSPGSVYPVLKRLAREGLVAPSEQDGRRVFTLTDSGRQLVDDESATWGQPWQPGAGSDARSDLWSQAQQLAAAVRQVSLLDDPALIEAATQALTQARKAIYSRLAE
ncbi:MAG: PadR family transcriptional regulator [Candidatus Nanopelagicales bacterium]